MHCHLLPQQNSLVETTYRSEAKETPLQLGHDQPDLIHVTGQHDAAARLLTPSPLQGDDIAQLVGLHLIGVWPELLGYYPSYLGFIA